MTTDPFARPIAVIDAELHDQVQRRENGINEILHGCFTAERATHVIDRLMAERCRAMAARDNADA